MKKSPKEIAALIIGNSPSRTLMPDRKMLGVAHKQMVESMEELGNPSDDDESEGPGEELSLLAGDMFDALKNEDEDAFADALQSFVMSCHEGR